LNHLPTFSNLESSKSESSQTEFALVILANVHSWVDKKLFFLKGEHQKKVELKKDLQCKFYLSFMCQPLLKFLLWQLLFQNGVKLKLSYKAFLKDVKVEANFQSRLKVSKQCFFHLPGIFNIFRRFKQFVAL